MTNSDLIMTALATSDFVERHYAGCNPQASYALAVKLLSDPLYADYKVEELARVVANAL